LFSRVKTQRVPVENFDDDDVTAGLQAFLLACEGGKWQDNHGKKMIIIARNTVRQI